LNREEKDVNNIYFDENNNTRDIFDCKQQIKKSYMEFINQNDKKNNSQNDDAKEKTKQKDSQDKKNDDKNILLEDSQDNDKNKNDDKNIVLEDSQDDKDKIKLKDIIFRFDDIDIEFATSWDAFLKNKLIEIFDSPQIYLVNCLQGEVKDVELKLREINVLKLIGDIEQQEITKYMTFTWSQKKHWLASKTLIYQ